MHIALAVALALAWASDSAAQSVPPITSNRPGISESEVVLVPHAIQVEAGTTFAAFSDAATRHHQWDFPEATFRVGVRPWLELFAVATGYYVDMASADGATTETTGGADVQLNAKVGLLSEQRHHITLSAAVGLSLPTGATAFSSGGYDPSLRLLWSKALPRDWSVSGNVIVSDITIEESRHSAAGAGLSTSHPITGAASWYVELFANATTGASSLWRVDGGVAIVTTPKVQLDLSAGRTLADGPGAWFISAGISARRLF